MNELFKLLTKECGPYLAELAKCDIGNLLVRGSATMITDYKKEHSRLEDRRPLNTPRELHDLINKLFLKKFGWNIRNGIFCYGWNILSDDLPYDLGYGEQYMVFPIGEFDFVYNPDHFDFFRFVTENKVDNSTLAAQIFRSDSLNDAINSREGDNEFSHEISVKANSAYLVNMKYKTKIMELIWKIS